MRVVSIFIRVVSIFIRMVSIFIRVRTRARSESAQLGLKFPRECGTAQGDKYGTTFGF